MAVKRNFFVVADKDRTEESLLETGSMFMQFPYVDSINAARESVESEGYSMENYNVVKFTLSVEVYE